MIKPHVATAAELMKFSQEADLYLAKLKATLRACRNPQLNFLKRAELLTECIEPAEHLRRQLVVHMLPQLIDQAAAYEATQASHSARGE